MSYMTVMRSGWEKEEGEFVIGKDGMIDKEEGKSGEVKERGTWCLELEYDKDRYFSHCEKREWWST